MVRVFKCHSFASQCVIPIKKEPLAIYADGDKVFVATSDCEILVFQVRDGASTEIQRCVTISPVDNLVYNSFRNYIATVELKKSWTKVTRSVRVYLNWESCSSVDPKPRTKVRMAGRSHVQHLSGAGSSGQLDIVEVPVDGNATCVGVCRYTGNFAVACGSEVKLCSVIEKTVPTSNKTYLDVEVFLELCWSFQVVSIALCEEFVVCCSLREVHGIRVRYEEGDPPSIRTIKRNLSLSRVSPATSMASSADTMTSNPMPPGSPGHGSMGGSPASHMSNISETIQSRGLSRNLDFSGDFQPQFAAGGDGSSSGKEFSTVGMPPAQQSSPKLSAVIQHVEGGGGEDSKISDDENFVEWDFDPRGNSGNSVCLPGLSTSQSQCHQHAAFISPPVLSNVSGGKVKSSSGVEAETVLHLNDAAGGEGWMSVSILATHSGVPPPVFRIPPSSTDRMKSSSSQCRTSICVYLSGTRGGYLYQLWPSVLRVSQYKYTDTASQIGLGQSHLYAVTQSGIETYTSRWGAVSLEVMGRRDGGMDTDTVGFHPGSALDICLCGHEPFYGAVSLSVATDFLALLSKVEDETGNEDTVWSLYILNCFSLQDQFKDMLTFAETIQTTGPASYIHLLQEAHLLISSHPMYSMIADVELAACLKEVSRLLGHHYAQPGQEDWWKCQPYYSMCGASLKDIVCHAITQAEKKNPREFGKGLLQYLNHVLCEKTDPVEVGEEEIEGDVCDNILSIMAVSAPEKLSHIILLSRLNNFTPESAVRHLKTWLSVKASASQPVTATDRLAMVRLHMALCDMDMACLELKAIPQPQLVSVCSSHPPLIHSHTQFSPLAQLMRQHFTSPLLQVLLRMLDGGSLSLDSLILLLKNPGEENIYSNNHILEILELILGDSSRGFLFDTAAHMLAELYVRRICGVPTPHPQSQWGARRDGQHKFRMPPTTGHFAPRYAWLDYLPPLMSPQKMTRACIHLEVKQRSEVKQMSGQRSDVKRHRKDACSCPLCNENLLKLQSLLCSPCLTGELATHILSLVYTLAGTSDPQQVTSNAASHPTEVDSATSDLTSEIADVTLDTVDKTHDVMTSATAPSQQVTHDLSAWTTSVTLLCHCHLDLPLASKTVVSQHPAVSASFAACCFDGDFDKYSHLLRCLEGEIKSEAKSSELVARGEIYVKAYKELLSKLVNLFPPSQFVRLLPEDGNLFFLMPFLCDNLKAGHTDRLKQSIVTMGKQLLYQT